MTRLLKLSQRAGEDSCAYMARTKSLLHWVPGFQESFALQYWIKGLRQPYRLEVAKTGSETLAEAEALVARMEDICKWSDGSDQ